MDPYIGEIRLFAGNFAPVDWHLCDGTLLQVSAYNTLFSLIGAAYGGDGVNTFAVPDFRGRVGLSQGTYTEGTTVTNYALGQQGGTETVTLTTASMAAHAHTLNTAGVAATTGTFDTTVTFANTTGQNTLYIKDGLPSSTAVQASPNTASVVSAGGSQGHNNVMPGLAVNYIICLNGIYPQFQ